jgi:hypothetical protein
LSEESNEIRWQLKTPHPNPSPRGEGLWALPEKGAIDFIKFSIKTIKK